MPDARERKIELGLDVATVSIWEGGKALLKNIFQKGAQKTTERLEEYSKRDQARDRAKILSAIMALEKECADALAAENLEAELNRRQEQNDGSEAEMVNSLIELYQVHHPNEYEPEEVWVPGGDSGKFIKDHKHVSKEEAAYLHHVWNERLKSLGHEPERINTRIEIIHDDRLEQFFGKTNHEMKRLAREIEKFCDSSPLLSNTQAWKEHKAQKAPKEKKDV